MVVSCAIELLPAVSARREMARLSDLALRAGRYVGPHISMLLASLEGAGLLPTEAEAQVGAD